MNLIECIRLAFSSILANKLRSLLTMLGIIIGISSVIIITTLGKSVSKTVEVSLTSLGLNQIYIYAVEEDSYDDEESSYMPVNLFTKENLFEFMQETDGVLGVIKTVNVGSGTIENFRNETVKTGVYGIANGNFIYDNVNIAMGRGITVRDIIEERRSAVVSDVFVKQYFRDNEDPVGKTIGLVIDNAAVQSFTIVGVYKAKEIEKRIDPGLKFIDLESNVYIPYTVADSIKGSNIDFFEYSAEFSMNPTINHKEGLKILKDFFNKKLEDKPGAYLQVTDILGGAKIFTYLMVILTAVFALIAMISLLVGGIGVMNIMLVSIVERTREIGVRKALGAKNSAIRMQFVIEAIMLCLIGGAIGITLGIGTGIGIDLIVDFIINNFKPEVKDFVQITVTPSLIAIIGSVLFCMATGVFFGFYPANKAAKMNPIDALRYD